MPRRPKAVPPDASHAPIPDEILDQFVRQGRLTPAELDTVVRRFKKAIIERALGAELSHHLGYVPGGTKPEDTTNHRNGSRGKTVLTDAGPLALAVPRDRDGSFEPRLIGKHERRFTGFDDKVVALYARGLTVREMQAFLGEMYGVEVSPDLISTVTDAVVAEVTAWPARRLEPMYPVVFCDALRVKIRDEAVVRSKAVYLALAVLPDGTREILGIWIEPTEGAKFWMKVFTDLKTRGGPRHPDRGDRRLEGHERGARRRIPRDHAADVHRASAAEQPRVRQLEAAQTAGRRPAPDLYRGERGCRRDRAGHVCRGAVGPPVPDRRRVLASRVDPCHSILCVSARGAPRHLHDQCARTRERPRAEDHQDARSFSQ
jgi:putative transposase